MNLANQLLTRTIHQAHMLVHRRMSRTDPTVTTTVHQKTDQKLVASIPVV